MADIKLFKVVNGELQIDKEEARGIKEFATILSRRKTCKGDHDGRKKVMATKELIYITFMADYSTYHSAFIGEERHRKAKNDADLPKNWKPDDEVNEAITKYKEILNEYSPTANILNTVEQGLMMSSEAVKGYIHQMKAAIEASHNMMKKLKQDKDSMEVIAAMQTTNSLVQSSIKDILGISKELPKALKQMRELKEQVKLERSEAKQLTGGKRKGNREDPK